MDEFTQLLHAAQQGDGPAAEKALGLLYADLRRQARQRLRQTGPQTLLNTTALVHESYLRLRSAQGPAFASREHFMAYAARAMRSVLVDLVRARKTERRGAGALHLALDTQLSEQLSAQDDQVLRVHEALQALAQQEPRLAQVVELRFFGGLGEADIAAALQLTERTVQRDWAKAKLLLGAWLRH